MMRSTKPLNKNHILRFFPTSQGTVAGDLPLSCESPKAHDNITLLLEGYSIRWECDNAYREAHIYRSTYSTGGFQLVARVVNADYYNFIFTDTFKASFKVVLVMENGDYEESNTVTFSQVIDTSRVASATVQKSRVYTVSNPKEVVFSPDGRIAYYRTGAAEISQFFLKNPYALDSENIIDPSISLDTSSEETNVRDFFLSYDGKQLIIIGDTDYFHRYTLSTPYLISSATYVDQFNYSTQESDARSIWVSMDGQKLWIVGVAGDEINEYAFGNPWDVSTISAVALFDLSSYDTAPLGIVLNIDQSRVYVLGNNGDTLEVFKNEGSDISAVEYVKTVSLASGPYDGLSLTPSGTLILITDTDITFH